MSGELAGDSAAPAKSDRDSGDGLLYGVFLLLVAGWFLWSAREIPAAGTNPRDPGPRVFPVMLAAALGLAGAGLVVQQVVQRVASGRQAAKSPPAEQQASLLRPLGALAALVLCTTAMPYVGFATAAFVYCVMMLRTWGAGWLGAVAASLGLVLLVQLLFVIGFRVVLPLGPFNF